MENTHPPDPEAQKNQRLGRRWSVSPGPDSDRRRVPCADHDG